MSDKRKATCPVPSAVIAACRRRFPALHARSPAAGFAQIIAEGFALLARAGETAPKRAELCHSKYRDFDQVISTHIPAALREQARQLKRARNFGSFQEIYLEAVLAALVDRGLLTSGLEAEAGDRGLAEPEASPRQAA
jgi:hypothetical protein